MVLLHPISGPQHKNSSLKYPEQEGFLPLPSPLYSAEYFSTFFSLPSPYISCQLLLLSPADLGAGGAPMLLLFHYSHVAGSGEWGDGIIQGQDSNVQISLLCLVCTVSY